MPRHGSSYFPSKTPSSYTAAAWLEELLFSKHQWMLIRVVTQAVLKGTEVPSFWGNVRPHGLWEATRSVFTLGKRQIWNRARGAERQTADRKGDSGSETARRQASATEMRPWDRPGPPEPATGASHRSRQTDTRVLLTGDRPRPTPRPGLMSVRAQICRGESGARGSSTASGCSGPRPAGRLSLDCSHQVEDQGVISQGEFQGLSHCERTAVRTGLTAQLPASAGLCAESLKVQWEVEARLRGREAIPNAGFSSWTMMSDTESRNLSQTQAPSSHCQQLFFFSSS